MVVSLVVILCVSFYYAFYRRDWTTSAEPKTVLQEALSRVCTEPQSSLRYEGVHSFFQYLEEPPQPLCPPTVKTLGGRTDEDHGDNKNETSVSYEVEGEGAQLPYACLFEDRKSLQEPCVAYSFASSVQNEVAEYAKSLGCLHHVFSEEASGIGRSSEAAEASISEEDPKYPNEVTGHPRDLRTSGVKRNRSFPEGEAGQHQPLEAMASSIRTSGQKIQLLNINVKGQEWPILTQIVLFHDLIDIPQVIARIHLPDEISTMSDVEMHSYFSGLHQIVRGLDCLGYGVVSSQPLVSEVMEIGSRRYPMALQVSWLKTKSSL